MTQSDKHASSLNVPGAPKSLGILLWAGAAAMVSTLCGQLADWSRLLADSFRAAVHLPVLWLSLSCPATGNNPECPV